MFIVIGAQHGGRLLARCSSKSRLFEHGAESLDHNAASGSVGWIRNLGGLGMCLDLT